MNNLKKEEIKVFVILGPPDSIVTTTRINSNDGGYIYNGFGWTIFQNIKRKLKDKYNFIVTFSDLKDNDYDKFIREVNENKYDIIIGEFFTNNYREKLINFTTPISIDSNAILHIKKTNPFSTFYKIFKKVSYQFLFLILLGLVFGLLLYFIESGREYHSKRLQKSNRLRFLRSIVTGISSMFGEMGYLSERSSLTIRGIILITIIMSIAFLFIMYIQGAITSSLIKEESDNITKNDSNKTLIGFKGYSTVNKLKRYGFKVIEVENLTTDDYIKEYLKNTEKYDGAIFAYCEAFEYLKKYPNLTISLDFGNEPVSFPVNKEKINFLEDVNKTITELRDNLELNRICKSYYNDVPNIPVCSLT